MPLREMMSAASAHYSLNKVRKRNCDKVHYQETTDKSAKMRPNSKYSDGNFEISHQTEMKNLKLDFGPSREGTHRLRNVMGKL